MTTTVEGVKGCAGVKEALLFLAARIDTLDALKTEFDAPLDWNDFPPDDSDIMDDETLSDDQKREALGARRRLRGEGGEGGEAMESKEPSKIQVSLNEDGATIDVPPATEAQRNRREHLPVFEGHQRYDTDDMRAAWVLGGPLWLHGFDRDHLMALPIEYRRSMVEDVGVTSEKDAQNLSADILKHGGPEDPNPRFAPDLPESD